MKFSKIFGIQISSVSRNVLLQNIEEAISLKNNKKITYAHFNTLNQLYRNRTLITLFNQFDYVHPDGVGILLTSKILFGGNRLDKRISGSDFYPELIKNAIRKSWRIFFFGDKLGTLEQIPLKNPKLNVAGYISGYDFDNDSVVNKINYVKPDILIVGLGQPKQEMWINEEKDELNVAVIIAVGDGIKVFAGTKKRGPKFIQKMGLEWFVRLIYNPKLYWKRYLIGIPLFILRVLKEKYRK
jgi:N-acetylglucosaminyldiphosphoundecaprenol N-acetyl-beta-D-mannosaminyltransferase